MGWFSSLMHDIGTPSSWFGSSNSSLQASIDAQTAATKAASAQAASDAAAALKAQQDANLLAQAASVPQSDSESARAASDDQKRKLMQGSSFGIGLQSALGAPPVGFRMLSGQ
ncbi:hypothetical protein [Bradyrhizobium sp.]|uniref:hypothetical protein n=1 Tax=Bradyrhizobium sp. TaxID=376 RepID=UPI0039E2CF46